MAKGNGTTRNSSPSAPNGAGKIDVLAKASSVPVTDRGMTDLQRAHITAFEAKHRNDRTGEWGMTVDRNGNVIADKKGNKSSVSWTYAEAPKDAVLTHNHPGSINIENGSKFYKSIGSPFSSQDLQFAILHDLAEIRAVTPNYTFSFRRPAQGWPTDFVKATKDIDKIYRKARREGVKYYNEASDGKYGAQRLGRINVSIWHRTAQQVVKATGAIYTRSKNTK